MLGLLLPARVFAGDIECVGAVINTYSEATQDAEENKAIYSAERHTKGLKSFFNSRDLPSVDEATIQEVEPLLPNSQTLLEANPELKWILTVNPGREVSDVNLTTSTGVLNLTIEAGNWDDNLKLIAAVVQQSCGMTMQDLATPVVQASKVQRNTSVRQVMCLDDSDCGEGECVNSVCSGTENIENEGSEQSGDGSAATQFYIGPHLLGKAIGGTLGLSLMGETLAITTEFHVSRLSGESSFDGSNISTSATYFGGRLMVGIGSMNEDTDHFLFSLGLNVGKASFDGQFGEEAFGISETVVGVPLQLRGNIGFFYAHLTVDPVNEHFFLGLGAGN